MIKVSRMNGLEFVVNADLIESIESTPDTVITMTTGRKFVLTDSVDEVIDKIIAYRKVVGTNVVYSKSPQDDDAEERN